MGLFIISILILNLKSRIIKMESDDDDKRFAGGEALELDGDYDSEEEEVEDDEEEDMPQ